MRHLKTYHLLFAALLLIGCKENKAADPAPAAEPKLGTLDQKISYMFAYSATSQLSEAGVNIDKDAYRQGLEDAMEKRDPRLSEDERRAASVAFQSMRSEAMGKMIRERNEKMGEQFLAENAKRDGVTQTQSGLQYEVLTSGKGASPSATDKVQVYYKGSLLNGKEFDSSLAPDEPVTFTVNQVIPGWTEVLQLMKEGDKWKVYIPGQLAYPNGTRNIEPGSLLVFEIELVKVLDSAK